MKVRYQEDLVACLEEVNTVYDRITFYSDLSRAVAEADLVIEAILEVVFIDKGKLDRETGEGFYQYPNPSFMNPGFLEG